MSKTVDLNHATHEIDAEILGSVNLGMGRSRGHTRRQDQQRHDAQEMKPVSPQTPAHRRPHSTVRGSQRQKAHACPSADPRTQNVVQPRRGTFLGHEKEQSVDLCRHVDGLGDVAPCEGSRTRRATGRRSPLTLRKHVEVSVFLTPGGAGATAPVVGVLVRGRRRSHADSGDVCSSCG